MNKYRLIAVLLFTLFLAVPSGQAQEIAPEPDKYSLGDDAAIDELLDAPADEYIAVENSAEEKPVAAEPVKAEQAEPLAQDESAEDVNQDEEKRFKIESGRDTENTPDGFYFGSYGRVPVTGDLDGHPGYSSNVVHHGARIMEGPYAELDFGYKLSHPDNHFNVKILSTLALFEGLFHYTGVDDQKIGLRNLYAEVSGFLPYVSLWMGSRMWRGDDIYLLDYWPLDNLNTYGGGLSVDWQGLQLRFHMGVNRLMDDYQYQEIKVPGRAMWAETITGLDRQRLISSLKATYHLFNLKDDFSMKFSAYGEFHHLPSGGLTLEDQTTQDLPSDKGFLAGAQIGMWGFGKSSHLNLFFKYAAGLAAYGEWSSPWGLADDYSTDGAYEFVSGASFNWESHWVGVTAGGYLRRFSDADDNKYDMDDFWEGIFTVRPSIYVWDHFQQAFELSYQQRKPDGIQPLTDKVESPYVVQFSVIEILSWDRSSFERPHFRLFYTMSYLNDHALNLYPVGDRRSDKNIQHFLGAGVEWWFNSSYK